MIIKLYNVNVDNNVLNKTLNNEVEYTIKLKNETNINEPTIILKSDVMINSNYAYIEDFNRFYYVENVTVFPNDIYNISLRCDVLMSFKDDILNSNAYIEQNINVNKYYDSGYQSEVRKEVTIYKSNVILEDNNSIILVTLGGL